MTSSRKRAALIGLGAALIYIFVTWGLYLDWQGDLESLLEGVRAGLPEDATEWERARAIAEALGPNRTFGPVLEVLLLPLPTAISILNDGEITFAAVALQGAVIGALIFLLARDAETQDEEDTLLSRSRPRRRPGAARARAKRRE